MASRLKIGVVTDIHYGTKDHGSRFCSQGLDRLREAIREFTSREVDLIVLLGDATDGGAGEDDQLRHVDEIASVLADAPAEALFIAGNHDLQDLSKKAFYERMWSSLPFPSDAMRYEYSYAVDRGGFRFIFLDSHFTRLGEDWGCGNFDWSEAYVRVDHLAWASQAAAGAPNSGFILVIHESLGYRQHEGGRDPHLVVNHRSVWDSVAHGNDLPPRAVLQGHYHPGRLAHRSGVPILTFAAMVEGAGPSNAFAVIGLESDAMSVAGFGAQHGAQILLADSAPSGEQRR